MKITKEQLVAFYSGDWFLITDSGNVQDKIYVDDLNLDDDQETWPDVIDTKDIEGVIQINWWAAATVSLSGVGFKIDPRSGLSFTKALLMWIKVTYAKSKTFTVTVQDDDLAAFEAFTKEKGIKIKILK